MTCKVLAQSTPANAGFRFGTTSPDVKDRLPWYSFSAYSDQGGTMRIVFVLITLLLSGPAYAQQSSCILGGTTSGPYLNHGDSRLYFKYETVPSPQSCS